MPIKEAFASPASYYSTALHELSHWTGHESRLNRLDKLARFGDKSYAAEELVAELGAAFLTARLDIPNERTLDNAAAYLGNWLSLLKTDSKAIFTAASAASAAADLILSFSQELKRKRNRKRLRRDVGSASHFPRHCRGKWRSPD